MRAAAGGPAPDGFGLGAVSALGHRGAGVRIVVVDGGGLHPHRDLPHIPCVVGVPTGPEPGHGVAVAGVLVGPRGLCPAASVSFASPWHLEPGLAERWRRRGCPCGAVCARCAGRCARFVSRVVARTGSFRGLVRHDVSQTLSALRSAPDVGPPNAGPVRPGDIVLLELQSLGGPAHPAGGPVELEPGVSSAVAALTARGVVVVEAAGNAPLDLDALPASPLADSAAILVGAAAARPGPGGSRSVRMASGAGPFASGARVDLHAAGEAVPTLGGGPGGREDRGRFDAFGGTSAAAAQIAGLIAVLQSARPASTPPLDGPAMRRLLVETAGAAAHDPRHPQRPRPELVGRWPDAAAALARLRKSG